MVRLPSLSVYFCLLIFSLACEVPQEPASSVPNNSEIGFVGNSNPGGTPVAGGAPVSSPEETSSQDSSGAPLKEGKEAEQEAEPGKALVTFNTGPAVEFLEPSGVSMAGVVTFKVATSNDVVRVEYIAAGVDGNGL